MLHRLTDGQLQLLTLQRPTDGQLQLLKGAEEDQVVRDIIRAELVMLILWEPAILWAQVAGKVELGECKPTVFQGHIVENLLNAVRKRRDNQDGVLHTPDIEK
jgi:hypothetical protein